MKINLQIYNKVYKFIIYLYSCNYFYKSKNSCFPISVAYCRRRKETSFRIPIGHRALRCYLNQGCLSFLAFRNGYCAWSERATYSIRKLVMGFEPLSNPIICGENHASFAVFKNCIISGLGASKNWLNFRIVIYKI